MSGQTLRVTWPDGAVRAITWRHSWLVPLLCTGAFTLGDTVRVHPNRRPRPFDFHLRHECQHSRQQAEYGKPLWRWVWRYLLSPAFRRRQEEDAEQTRPEWREDGVLVGWPRWTVVREW